MCRCPGLAARRYDASSTTPTEEQADFASEEVGGGDEEVDELLLTLTGIVPGAWPLVWQRPPPTDTV